MMYTCKKT